MTNEVRKLNDEVRERIWKLGRYKKFPSMYMTMKEVRFQFELTKEAFYRMSFRIGEKHIDRRFDGIKLDMAQVRGVDGLSYCDTANYPLIQMFDAIYFELDKHLTDTNKAKLLSAFTGRSHMNWVLFLSAFNIGYRDLTIEFIKHGRRILTAPSLYKLRNDKYYK